MHTPEPMPVNARLHSLIESRPTLDWRDLTGLVIVEPDPESWMPTAQAVSQAALILRCLEQAFLAQAEVSPRMWIGAVNAAESLFEPEGRFAPIQLRGAMTSDSEVWISLHDLLAGIAQREPQAAFGLIGATRQDEVQRTAEAVAACGLRAVVLERLCLSAGLFYDVEAAVADAVRVQMARRVLTGEDGGPLDDV